MSTLKSAISVLCVLVLTVASLAAIFPASTALAGPRTPDSDNAFGQATALASGVAANGDVSTSDDLRDYFGIQMNAGQTLSASLSYTNSSANLRLRLFDPATLQMANISSVSTLLGTTILAFTNGTYFIEVRAVTGQSAYTLTATTGTPGDLTVGNPVSGALSNLTDRRADIYRFWLEGNVTTNSTETARFDITVADPSAIFRLNMTDLLAVTSTQSYNETWYSQVRTDIEASASYTGWYYLTVSVGNGNSSYSVTSTRSTAPSDGDNDARNATAVPRNAIRYGSVNKARDHYDWYRYSVMANDNCQVRVNRFNNSDVFYLSAFSPNLSFISGDNNLGGFGTQNFASIYIPSETADRDILVAVGMTLEASNNPQFLISDREASMDYQINFTSPDHPPVVLSTFDNITISEDEVYPINMSNHFRDPDGDKLSFTLTGGTHAALANYNITTGFMDLVPASNWFGTEKYTVVARDPKTLTNTAFLNVTVLPVNDAPFVKFPITNVTMLQGATSSYINLTKVFFDNDTATGDSLNYSFADNGAIAVSIVPGANVTLTCSRLFSGQTTVNFSATDTAGVRASAPCNITVTHVNQPPSLVAAPLPLSFPEDTNGTANLSSVFADPEGDTVTVVPAANPDITVVVDAPTQVATLVPRANFFGTANLTVASQDIYGVPGDSAVWTVTVTPVNDPPVLSSPRPAGGVYINETDLQQFGITATDIDSPSVSFTWSVDGVPVNTTGANFTLQTDFNSSGNHTVTVTASDGEANSSKSWALTVANRNRPPSSSRILTPAGGSSFNEKMAVDFSAAGSDPDGDALTYTWYDGNKEIGKGANFTTVKLSPGTHSITVEAYDGAAGLTSGIASITIVGNRPPSITLLRPQNGTKFEAQKTVTFRVTATDPDNDTISYSWSENGHEISNTASFSTSSLGAGVHTIHLSLTDGKTYTNVTVTVEITPAGAIPLGILMPALGIMCIAGLLAGLLVGRRKRAMLQHPAGPPSSGHPPAQSLPALTGAEPVSPPDPMDSLNRPPQQ